MKMIGAMFNGKPVVGMQHGTSEPVEFHSWRAPEMGDRLDGQTMKFNLPSSPIQIKSFDECGYNNYAIITSNSRYWGREFAGYEYLDGADDGSWTRQKFTAAITIQDNQIGEYGGVYETIYESETIVYFDNNAGTQRVESCTEITRKPEITLPSDFGTLIAYSMYLLAGGIQVQVDDYSVKKRGYQLVNLSANDSLASDTLLIPTFPVNADTLLVPNPPAANEYGMIDLGSAFTLFAIENEYGYYALMANMYEVEGKRYFSVVLEEMMQGQTMFYKEYGSSSVTINNSAAMLPAMGSSYTFSSAGLNTSSPLYPYIKKVQWTEN